MDIDRKLLSKAAALLREVLDAIDRVRKKASDYPAEGTDESVLEELVTFTNDIELIISKIDKLTQEN